jgi:hypothetical protein
MHMVCASCIMQHGGISQNSMHFGLPAFPGQDCEGARVHGRHDRGRWCEGPGALSPQGAPRHVHQRTSPASYQRPPTLPTFIADHERHTNATIGTNVGSRRQAIGGVASLCHQRGTNVMRISPVGRRLGAVS